MYRLTPKEEVSARVRALQRRLGRDGVDAAFLVQNADLFYFTGSIQPGVLIVHAAGGADRPGGGRAGLLRPPGIRAGARGVRRGTYRADRQARGDPGLLREEENLHRNDL